jgi:hypothetical protein
MRMYYTVLYTSYPLEDGTHWKKITEPTEYYSLAIKEYEEIIKNIENKMVYDQSEIPYNNGYYDHHFQIELLSQDYSHGDFRGYAINEKGSLEYYIGEYIRKS